MTGLQNSHNPSLADYDWRRFARDVRRKVQESGKALRPLAPEIGVTFTDLSRACGGQMIGTGKVIALCDAFGFDLRAYYVAPDNINENSVLQLASRETGFHADRADDGCDGSAEAIAEKLKAITNEARP